jgi:centromeric protein E
LLQIIDEKSLIKKYQREISVLKLELDQLKQGMLVGVSHEEIMTLKQKVFSFVWCSFHVVIVEQDFVIV